MLEKIIVTNHLNQSLEIELTSPEKSGLVITSIENLGPVKADISMTNMAGLDGAVYNSSRKTYRNLVFKFRYFPLPQFISVEECRKQIYRYFPLGKKITVRVVTDKKDVLTRGYVESNDPDFFSRTSGSVVSIICEKSYWEEIVKTIVSFSSVEPEFEFPFSNEHLTQKLIVISSLTMDTTKSVIYNGDGEMGLLFHIHANGSAHNVTLTKVSTLESLAIDSYYILNLTGANISAGDDIYISTVRGNKYAKLIRGEITYNILNALGTDPVWFELEKGDNIFAYEAMIGIENLDFEIIHDVVYDGV